MLSAEVIDHILSFLQSDPASLKACSESHPFLSRLAERHQFAHIVLRQPLHTEFTRIFADRPHLFIYVRSIQLNIGNWDPKLLSILPKLRLLKRIELSGERGVFFWDRLPESSRRAFLNCIHSSSVDDVCISNISGFPLSALNDAKPLKRLTLYKWWEKGGRPQLNSSTSDKLQLGTLSLEEIGKNALQNVIAWAPTCTLRSLEVSYGDKLLTINNNPYDLIPSLLAACSDSLTNLQLSVGNHCASHFYMLQLNVNSKTLVLVNSLSELNFPFTLSALSHLEKLTFRAEVRLGNKTYAPDVYDQREREFLSPIPAIKNVLKTISSKTLQLLKIEFRFVINNYLASAKVIWAPLVRLLAESPFPCVNFHVGATFSSFADENVVPDLILNSLVESEELMRYVKRGVLVITPELPETNRDTPAAEKTSTALSV